MTPHLKEMHGLIEKELFEWDGASFEIIDGRGKHPKLKLMFGKKYMSKGISSTPSDARTRHNVISDVRRMLRQMGAERDIAEDEEAELAAAEAAEKKAAEKKAAKARPKNEGKAKRPDPEPIEKGPADTRETVREGLTGFLDDVGLELQPKRITADPEVDRDGWGFYTDLTPIDYHADPCPQPSISNSLMSPILEKTMADAKQAHVRLTPPTEEEIEERNAVIRGDVAHQLLLGKGRGYEIGDYKDFRTKAAKEWRERCAEMGITPILRSKYDELKPMVDRAREKIDEILEGAEYETEVVVMCQLDTIFGPIWCRGMLDIWCPEKAMVIDPKITGQLYDGTIERHALNMGWDRQGAWYKMLISRIMPEIGGRVQFIDLLINPDPPYVSRQWRPEASWGSTCVKQIEVACHRFAKAIYSQEWPEFPPGVNTGEIPPWEAKNREAAELRFLEESRRDGQ